MIFAVEGHINMIRNGLFYDLASKPEFSEYIKGLYPPRHKSGAYPLIIKTESRRPNRGIYQIEAERKKPHYTGYAVQPKRGVPAEPDIRIVMDAIWEEWCAYGKLREIYQILPVNAWAEGGYTPEQYEKVFRELNPKWDGQKRWVFKFHVIEVRK